MSEVPLHVHVDWGDSALGGHGRACFFFLFTLVTGPRRSLRLKLSDARVYEPQIRARLGTTAHFCEVVLYKSSCTGATELLAGMGEPGYLHSSLLLSSLEWSDQLLTTHRSPSTGNRDPLHPETVL